MTKLAAIEEAPTQSENIDDPIDPPSSPHCERFEEANAPPDNTGEFTNMPRLVATTSFKQPQVRWQQTDTLVQLSIDAADAVEYRIGVRGRELRIL